jgi:hypothetical protein|tara:strand:+ start:397 stop:534 length:138 start_codon:yes stop_codon:yes gene_type:complete
VGPPTDPFFTEGFYLIEVDLNTQRTHDLLNINDLEFFLPSKIGLL